MTDDDTTSLARRTVLGIAGAGILGLGAVSGGAAEEHQEETGSDDDTESGGYDVDEILNDWDQEAVDVVEPVIEKYGDPDEAVPSRLIWHQEDDDDNPWQHTIMFRDPVPHNFPMEHPDYLEQSINLHVPPDQYDEVATYDGSVMLERTKGVVSARCDKEAMNFLAINLTHELVFGDLTVEEARREYAADAMAFTMEDEEPPRTQGIQFELPDDDQRDPDVEIIVDGEIEMDQDIGTETEMDEETPAEEETETETPTETEADTPTETETETPTETETETP